MRKIQELQPAFSDFFLFRKKGKMSSVQSSKALASGIAVNSSPNVLLVDNFDSFTWNVYQSLCNLGAKVQVVRNDQKQVFDASLTHLVISPGPGHPSAAGISNEMIKMYEGKIPILGVCLGQQCMYEIYGGRVGPCGELVHGKTTPLIHDQKGLFKGVSMNIECTRYHSLAGELDTLPEALVVNCWTESGIVMGVRHKKYVIEGVQFHPESIASEQGDKIFGNFLSWIGGTWDVLTIHPERVKAIGSDRAFSAASGTGIPLSQASKINSTAIQTTNLKSTSILVKIVNQRKKDVLAEKLAVPMEYPERTFALGLSPTLISFPQRLRQAINTDGIAVIAEIKRASPSKGDIDANVHAPQQALLYARGGAAAISVLTEPTWFKGIKSLIIRYLGRFEVDEISTRISRE
jgi:anthranilate synthase/indole-3-glycerol phosphate synthase/phosphoribosylanthranilate isomerase